MATQLKPQIDPHFLSYNAKAEREMVGRARELKPLLEKHAPYGDEHGTLHPEVFAALGDAGFWGDGSTTPMGWSWYQRALHVTGWL